MLFSIAQWLRRDRRHSSQNSSPICINSAQTDLLGNLMQSTISQYEINIGNDVLEKLKNSNELIIDLVLTSPDSVTNFPILGIQNLYYSINMDLNTDIKLNWNIYF